ncbi:toxic anion resistance protein [Lysinibacillus antri]|uniref:Toxic anion resistance protein n=1 Tax=Lysinibacillus antri TaxID=2498145 RepID=A0A432LCV9_9BACI|nr:toxic anion resistance protein [Lysinibacillus antri]RUL53985.1 toxic anion resistance protein [Lysinibacillus antri]
MTEKKSSNNPLEALPTSGGSFFDVELSQNTTSSPTFYTLNTEDQSRALLVASKLDVSVYENVLKFGSDVQQSLKNFTHNMLVRVQRNDTSPIREVLHKLMEHLESINPDDLIENERGFFSKLFKKTKSSIQEVVSQYNRLSKHIDRLSIQLQHAQKGLLNDMNMLNDLYHLNEDYFHNLTIYIAAGEMKRDDLLKNELPKLEALVATSSNPMDQQRLNDLKTSIEWIDKRIYDLQISREIAIQTAPQIRLIQQTNQMLVEKIQSSVMSTIPLWQSQISMLININNQRRANMTTQRLMETSDKMIQKNAKMLDVTGKDAKRYKTITHEDVDHFKETQMKLLHSIEETLRVQAKSNEQQAAIDVNIEQLK